MSIKSWLTTSDYTQGEEAAKKQAKEAKPEKPIGIGEKKKAEDKADKDWYDQYMKQGSGKIAAYQRKQAEEAGGYGDTKKAAPAKPAAKPKPKAKPKAAKPKMEKYKPTSKADIETESTAAEPPLIGGKYESPNRQLASLPEKSAPQGKTTSESASASESKPAAKRRGKFSRFLRATGRGIGAVGRGVGRGARAYAKSYKEPAPRKTTQSKSTTA